MSSSGVAGIHLNLAPQGSVLLLPGSVTRQQSSPRCSAWPKPDLVEQGAVFAALHWPLEHGIEPAVEAPGVLPELPADREVLGLGGALTAAGAPEMGRR